MILILTLIGGVDLTNYVDPGGLTFSLGMSDSPGKADIVVDNGGTVALPIDLREELEVVLHDETLVLQTARGPVPLVPAHNLLVRTRDWTDSAWAQTGTLASAFTYADTGHTLVLTFTGASGSSSSAFCRQSTLYGYVTFNRSYMCSVYVTVAAPLVRAQGLISVDILGRDGTLLTTVSSGALTSTMNNARQRISFPVYTFGEGPYASASYLRVSFGGNLTGSTPTGAITFDTPQLEPMWFDASAYPPTIQPTWVTTYPTPDCHEEDAGGVLMPDNTVSRATRVYAGYIDDLSVTGVDGPSREWTLSVAPAEKMLDSGGATAAKQINVTYQNNYDDEIIVDIIAQYFRGLISTNAPNSLSSSPIVRGIFIANVTFTDTTFRDVLNTLIAQSGYIYTFDAYYRLSCLPAYSNQALWDAAIAPDDVTSFAYHDYALHIDATQKKRQVKVVGEQFLAPAITDIFTSTTCPTTPPTYANGTTKIFLLSEQPYDVKSITVGSTAQVGGVWGVQTFAEGYDCLIDKANKHLLFNTAPASTVSMTYTYEAPVTALVLDQQAASDPVVRPAYVVPSYLALVHDSSITNIAGATRAGLMEVNRYGQAIRTVTFATFNHFTPPGTFLRFTSAEVDASLLVQSVAATLLGGGVMEYAYQCGDYTQDLSLISILRNTNRALKRKTTDGYVTRSQQIDLVVRERLAYTDSLTITEQPLYPAGVYGILAHYGSSAYGGHSGIYGDANSRYDSGTIYSGVTGNYGDAGSLYGQTVYA